MVARDAAVEVEVGGASSNSRKSMGNPNVNPWRICVTVTDAPGRPTEQAQIATPERRGTHVGRGDDRLLGVVEQHRQIGRAARRQRRQLPGRRPRGQPPRSRSRPLRSPARGRTDQAADVAQAVAVRAAASVHAARRAAAVPHPAGAVGIVQRTRHHAGLGDGAACRGGRCALGAAGGSGGRHLDRVGEPPCVALAARAAYRAAVAQALRATEHPARTADAGAAARRTRKVAATAVDGRFAAGMRLLTVDWRENVNRGESVCVRRLPSRRLRQCVLFGLPRPSSSSCSRQPTVRRPRPWPRCSAAASRVSSRARSSSARAASGRASRAGTACRSTSTSPCRRRRSDGPFPLVVDLHGWGLGKTAGPQTARAKAGYVVVSYTARGFDSPCGSRGVARARPHAHRSRRLREARLDPARRRALRGARHAASGRPARRRGARHPGPDRRHRGVVRRRPVDDPRPRSTTASCMPDGTLVPWKSPGGLDMAIAAAAPLIPWSDLALGADAERPHARLRDGRIRTARAPASRSSRGMTALYELGARDRLLRAGGRRSRRRHARRGTRASTRASRTTAIRCSRTIARRDHEPPLGLLHRRLDPAGAALHLQRLGPTICSPATRRCASGGRRVAKSSRRRDRAAFRRRLRPSARRARRHRRRGFASSRRVDELLRAPSAGRAGGALPPASRPTRRRATARAERGRSSAPDWDAAPSRRGALQDDDAADVHSARPAAPRRAKRLDPVQRAVPAARVPADDDPGAAT